MSTSSAETISIPVGPYELRPVTGIRQDDLGSLFGGSPGVYICNAPEPAWYERFGLERKYNYGIEKKHSMFARMPPGSRWVSPTFDIHAQGDTSDFQSGPIEHLGYGRLRSRPAQVLQTLKLIRWLIEHRSEYAFVYVYNFYIPYFAAPMFAKALLGKRLYVDYEDDYSLVRPWAKATAERVLRKSVDGVVCINEEMVPHFEGKEIRVFNAFADLSYLSDMRPGLFEGMSFLFSGRLDEIRGIDLVPSLVESLRKRLSSFRIQITGDGPLRSLVQSWKYPEVEYLGFLDDQRFAEVITAADVCLILQKPDHPFSRGSFPSKIDSYAQHRRPIWMLECR